ncbi:MAG: TIGR02147 family protein [Bdellovibrionota bacterium]
MYRDDIPRDFRAILKSEYVRRCERADKYTSRAFAKDLGFSEARLSEVMKGRYGISPEVAKKLVSKLELEPSDAQIFLDLVAAHHSRSTMERSAAKERLGRLRSRRRVRDSEDFGIFSNWIYCPLLELITINSGDPDSDTYSKALGVSSLEVFTSIKDLIAMGCLQQGEDGRLIDATPFVLAESPVRSETIRGYHRAMLEKAAKAIDQPIERRKHSSSVLSIPTSDIPEARAMIEDFVEQFVERFGHAENADAVYAMSLQFFQIAAKESH